MKLNEKSKRLYRMIYSIVALTLLLVLLATATQAWLSSNLSSTVTGDNDYITIDPGSGLEMNYGEEDMNQSVIDINKVVKEDFAFRECSSYNGKRLYFPLSEYSPDGDNDFISPQKEDFIFREATVGDKNSKYISIDLSLYSKNPISVWLSNDTKIEGGAADAIRIAFIENEPGGKTTIFDNSDQGYGETYHAVGSLKSDGSVDSKPTIVCNSLGNYTFDNEDGNVLFELQAGIEKFITVNIWLEGTDAQCNSSIAGLEDLDIFIKFSTTSEEEKTYYFIDHTLEQWVDDDDCYVFAINQNGKKNPMRKSDNYENDRTWIVDLPVSTKSLQFARYNPDLQENKPQEWNIWDAGEIGSCNIYNAFAHNTGIWDNDFQPTTITFYDALPDHPIIDQSSNTEMYVSFATTDGNNIENIYEYKMSNQWNERRWRVNIPSEVTNITFTWYSVDDDTGEIIEPWLWWENTERGTNTYFTANDYSNGYWSNKLMYLDGQDYSSGCMFAAYFYGSGDPVWTGMMSTTESGRYVVAVPDGKTGVVFCRYEEYLDHFGWDGVYNQTLNTLETFGNNNLFKITGYTGENNKYLNGTWYYTTNE